MTIPNWLRWVPHPLYGNYGGRPRRCRGETCPMPVDSMDWAFMEHDRDLYEAKHLQGEIQQGRARDIADRQLALALRRKLSPYKHKIWGPTYNLLAKFIFRM